MGIEPTTACLEGRCSTAELRPRIGKDIGNAQKRPQSQVLEYLSRGIRRHHRRRWCVPRGVVPRLL